MNPITERRNTMSRRELARKTGISYETLCMVETGQRNELTDYVAKALEKVFDVEYLVLQIEYTLWKQRQ